MFSDPPLFRLILNFICNRLKINVLYFCMKKKFQKMLLYEKNAVYLQRKTN